MREMIFIEEPELLFSHEQATEDPRDGLTLFGPLDRGKPFGIRCGIVGTADGVRRFRGWMEKVKRPVVSKPAEVARPPFPGFEEAFGIPWRSESSHEITLDSDELHRRIRYDDRHQRIYAAVDLYANSISRIEANEDTKVDQWFVVVPDDLHRYCRPKSTVEPSERIAAPESMKAREAAAYNSGQQSLFDSDSRRAQAARAYEYEPHFHNQLKARLLEKGVITQVVRESTIAHAEVLNSRGKPLRDLRKMDVDIAWHLSTAAFYKSGGRPWKISGMREGVCYLGIVFKQVSHSRENTTACCAAQMFLDSGDGVVFKGNIGPWYSPKAGNFHLSKAAAKEILDLAIKAYKARKGDDAKPTEIFVHAKTKFDNAEWEGFREAAGTDTNIVTVQIQQERDLKLFRLADHPVLRGLALVIDDRSAYLWTKGLVPRLGTYVGREVPNPLIIKICRGEASIETVLKDVLGLTKLNYNACRHSDGEPVTLKFADAVGEILTAGPIVNMNVPPLPFKHYI